MRDDVVVADAATATVRSALELVLAEARAEDAASAGDEGGRAPPAPHAVTSSSSGDSRVLELPTKVFDREALISHRLALPQSPRLRAVAQQFWAALGNQPHDTLSKQEYALLHRRLSKTLAPN